MVKNCYFWMRRYLRWGKYYAVLPIAWVRVRITLRWHLARFFAAWAEYQKGPNYRERLVCFGMAQAIQSFVNSRWEQRYCLKLRLQKEPYLRWQILFAPKSIAMPDDLKIAAEQGYCSDEAMAKTF